MSGESFEGEIAAVLAAFDRGAHDDANRAVALLAPDDDASGLLTEALRCLLAREVEPATRAWLAHASLVDLPSQPARVLATRLILAIDRDAVELAERLADALFRELPQDSPHWAPTICETLFPTKYGDPNAYDWICRRLRAVSARHLAPDARFRICALHICLVAQQTLPIPDLRNVVQMALDGWSFSKVNRFLTSYNPQPFYELSQGIREIGPRMAALQARGGNDAWLRLYEYLMIAVAVDGALLRTYLADMSALDAELKPTPDHNMRYAEGVVRNMMTKSATERPTSTPPRARPLRIAVCISGQLRGYREAHRTWSALGLDKHDTSWFVHTWCEVGAKMPNPSHAYRVFSGAFLQAYLRQCSLISFETMMTRYPTLFQAVGEIGRITPEQLLEEYGADTVVVVDDEADGAFTGKSNSWKMYHKMKAAHDLMKDSGKPFDLVVRIRPDKEVLPETAPDWHEVLELCQRDRVVFTDGPFALHDAVGFIVGDQVGISTPDLMDAYVSADANTVAAAEGRRFGFPQIHYPHINLAITLATDAILARLAPGIRFGSHFDIPQAPSREIRRWLLADIGPAPRDETDAELLAALETDIAAQPQDYERTGQRAQRVVPRH